MQSYSQFSIKQNKYNNNHYDLYLFNEKVYQKHYEWQIKVLFCQNFFNSLYIRLTGSPITLK